MMHLYIPRSSWMFRHYVLSVFSSHKARWLGILPTLFLRIAYFLLPEDWRETGIHKNIEESDTLC
jgi:hypothetical protein